MGKLTDARENYVLGLIAGKSQRVAYRAAYPNCKASDAAVDVAASKLFKDPKVRLRYDELHEAALKPARDAAIATAQEVLAELTAIGLGTKVFPSLDMFGKEHEAPVTVPARLKALELLAKHHGILTDKVEVGNADGKSFEVNIQVID